MVLSFVIRGTAISLVSCLFSFVAGVGSGLQGAETVVDPHAGAELIVTDQVLRPSDKVPPLGTNGWRCLARAGAPGSRPAPGAGAAGPGTARRFRRAGRRGRSGR